MKNVLKIWLPSQNIPNPKSGIAKNLIEILWGHQILLCWQSADLWTVSGKIWKWWFWQCKARRPTTGNTFWTELANASNCGIHIIILVEEEGYFCLEDIKEWVNPFQKKNPRAISGNTIYKILSRYLEYYDMEIQFCDKAGAGERILELLKAA